MCRRRAISGKIVVLLILIAAAAGPATVYVYLTLIPHTTDSVLMTGSLLVNSRGGTKEGGSGDSATFNASLSAKGGSGSLTLTLVAGGPDHLLQHQYGISNLIANDTAVSMLLNGEPVVLVLVTNDSNGGGQFSGSFVAMRGPTEQRGTISSSTFGGIGSSSDVELRLIPVASPRPTFMEIRPLRSVG